MHNQPNASLHPGADYAHAAATVIAVAGCGLLMRIIVDRITQRLDQLDRKTRLVGLSARQPVDISAFAEDIREQVEQVIAEELGAREGVHAQGYAEGYVDGIARRGGNRDGSAN